MVRWCECKAGSDASVALAQLTRGCLLLRSGSSNIFIQTRRIRFQTCCTAYQNAHQHANAHALTHAPRSLHPPGKTQEVAEQNKRRRRAGDRSSPRTEGSPGEDSRLRKDTSTSTWKLVRSKTDGLARKRSPLCADSDNSIL